MDDILEMTEHRPWPIPERNHVMQQRWNDLLFAHWPIPKAMLGPLLPPGLEADTFDGQAWVSVVPFWMDHIRLRGLPEMPGSHRFAELNLRTYVRSRETMVPGVYFFSLDAANPLAVLAARSWFRLPYFWASMQHEEKSDGLVHYSSRRLMTRKPVRFKAKYRGLGRPPSGMAPMQEIVNGQVRVRYAATPGSLEHFLVERYCLFTRWGNDVRMSNIHHSPWPLEEAEAEIEMNELPESFGIELPRRAPIVHYSRELAVYVWAPEAVGERAPMGAVPA